MTAPRRGRAYLLWTALVLTVAAPVVLNAVNLYRLSVDRLGLTGPAALALPVTLDGAALVALIVRLQALRDGDSAPGASVAVVGFAGLSAWLAGVEGWTVGGTVGALALGVLPIVAVVMLDLAVGSIRRADLRAAGLLPGRAPVYSGLRWILAPRSTAAAWRHGVLWENPDRLACLAATTDLPPIVIRQHDPHEAEQPAVSAPEIEAPAQPALAAGRDALPELAGQAAPAVGTKRDLVRSLIEVGVLDRAGIVAECARHGVTVSDREVTRLLAEHRDPRPSAVSLIRARRDTR